MGILPPLNTKLQSLIMLDSLAKAISFILVIGLGYFLKKIGKLHPNDFAILSRVVMLVTLPCALLTNLNGTPVDITCLYVFLLGMGCNVATIVVGWFMTRGRRNGTRVFSMLNLSGFSIGLFAMPYVQQFLPPEGFLTVCVFDGGNAMLCTGLTFAALTKLYPCGPGKMKIPFFRTVFSSLPIWCYIVIIVLGITGLSLPHYVINFTKIAGDANPFLCMLMIGVVLELHLDHSRFRRLLYHLAARYAVIIPLAFLFYFLLPFAPEIRLALSVILFAPVASINLVFTMHVHGDMVLAANISTATTIISILAMTIILTVV